MKKHEFGTQTNMRMQSDKDIEKIMRETKKGK